MCKKELIPEIFNYCDRWCERCPFSNRCEIFDPADQEKDWSEVDADEFIKEIKATFEKTMDLLKNEADANGMNWNQLVADANDVELKEPVLPKDHEEVITIAGNYRGQVTKWLMEHSNDIKATAVTMVQKIELGIEHAQENNTQFVDAIENINWYHTLIEAKLRRAISGLNSDLEEEQGDSTQSHANGCAKITMLFINKSIHAWQQIGKEMSAQEDHLLDHLALLSRIRDKVQKIFPAHEAFIRPGFDTFTF